jgi:hypothetical protein
MLDPDRVPVAYAKRLRRNTKSRKRCLLHAVAIRPLRQFREITYRAMVPEERLSSVSCGRPEVRLDENRGHASPLHDFFCGNPFIFFCRRCASEAVNAAKKYPFWAEYITLSPVSARSTPLRNGPNPLYLGGLLDPHTVGPDPNGY